jgi:hypothetical protein
LTDIDEPDFDALISYLLRVPAVQTNSTPSNGIGRGATKIIWWVKFGIDLDHALAWHVVQEFGHVLNYLSLEEPLPTIFKPVSPPPYMNGGPHDYLSWVIECPREDMTPDKVALWLESRLPQPVEDPTSWRDDEEDD